MIKKVASNLNLPTEYSRSITESQDTRVEKFSILIHHMDDYVLNTDSHLIGDRLQHIQQLETLGYSVVSINPTKWKGLALSSTEEKASFLENQFRLVNCDVRLRQNFSHFREDIL